MQFDSVLAFLLIRIYAIFDKKRGILYVTVPLGLLSVLLSTARTFYVG